MTFESFKKLSRSTISSISIPNSRLAPMPISYVKVKREKPVHRLVFEYRYDRNLCVGRAFSSKDWPGPNLRCNIVPLVMTDNDIIKERQTKILIKTMPCQVSPVLNAQSRPPYHNFRIPILLRVPSRFFRSMSKLDRSCNY